MADTGTAGWVRRDPEPFESGNWRSATHRARSPREVEALAEQVRAELLTAEWCPAYLKTAPFAERVTKYAKAEARYRLLSAYLDELGFGQVLAEMGGAEAPSRDQRALPAYQALMRAQASVQAARSRIGLSPVRHGDGGVAGRSSRSLRFRCRFP